MPLKYTVILNPQAKRGKAVQLCEELYLRDPKKISIERTTGPDDATGIARRAVQAGAEVVVAAGGDGTFNEVINGLSGSQAILGILPFGSVNVLARQLKIPLSLKGAWSVIERGNIKTFDLVKVEYSSNGETKSRYFIQLAGVGLDAMVIQKVTTKKKKKWGPLSYIIESLPLIPKTLPKIIVKVDGREAAKGSFILMGNGNYYGGPFNYFNRASMTDGLLDIHVYQSTGYLNILRYLFAIFLKAQNRTRDITYLQEKSVEVISPSQVPLEIDGEFVGFLPARFTVIPQGLKILVP